MRSKSKSFAEQLLRAQLMAKGLRANSERMKKRGISDDFIDTLDHSLVVVMNQNSEQETLKSSLKAATLAMNTTLDEIHAMMAEAVKLVKVEMPQVQWREFGIEEKH